MSPVTQLLDAAAAGAPQAAADLLPLVYDELRKLATVRLASEKPGQTLQATALVHEAGSPIRIAVAIVSGWSILWPATIGAAPAAWKPIMRGRRVAFPVAW